VKSYYHFNKIPWSEIMISGHVLDPKGKAMHKSLGNVIDPMKMIEKYSTDMLRYWTTSGKLGEDISFQEKELVTGGKLLTKLWNSSKFISPNLKKTKNVKLSIIDKWLMTKLMKTIKEATDNFNKYDYSVARAAVDSFFWSTFCDNYLEMVKYRIYGSKDEAAQSTLYDSLLSILKLYNPIIPHVTEDIYQNLFKELEKDNSICVSNWPEYDESLVDGEAEIAGDFAVKVISILRQWKHENKLALNAPLKEIIISCDSKDQKILEKVTDDVKGTMKVENIIFKESKDFSIDVKQ
jgi:valyl-tRNA synthetase